MPALFFLCFCLFTASLFFKKWFDPLTVRRDILASITYFANWTRALSIGIPIYLGHTWSLAIEEQFYLLWAPVFILLSSRKVKVNILIAVFFLLIISIVWPFYLENLKYPTLRIYNGFDTHCSGLIMGCFVALTLQWSRGEVILKKVSKFLYLSIIGLIFLLVFYKFGSQTVSSVITDVCAIILILSAYYSPKSLIGKLLGMGPLVTVGKISYSLYLWHYPIFLFLYSHRLPWVFVASIGIPASFLFATFSFYLIEKNALALRRSNTSNFKAFGIVTVSLSVIGMTIAGIFFFHDTVIDGLFPKPVYILEFEPHRLKVGTNFNVQGDNESYLWMIVSQTLDVRTKLRINDKDYEINISGKRLTVKLPRNLLLKVGNDKLTLVLPDGKLLTSPVFLDVIK